jgi:hypothetical protein
MGSVVLEDNVAMNSVGMNNAYYIYLMAQISKCK